MLELTLCSLLTVFPDYLLRRIFQGKRWGIEITFFSVWYELRWGITLCVILTVTLITVVFYYHPSTRDAATFFRTVTILSESSGRVAEVLVENDQVVEAGDPLFRLDDSEEQAAVETAERRIAEIEAAEVLAQSEAEAARGAIDQAEGAYQQAVEELETKRELQEKNPDIVAQREIERLENIVDERFGALEAAQANLKTVEAKLSTLLPAQEESARAALHEAEVALTKTTVVAGIDGRVHQLSLQPGDIVSPLMRPAGILVPTGTLSGHQRVQAGFNQVAAQVIRSGMIGEISCASKPFTVIPVVVIGKQEVVAAGQVRPTDQLLDVQDRARPGTITAMMEPLYEGQLDDVPPGSKCIANVYTSNHERLATEDLGTAHWLFLHLVDTVGLIHALILRIHTFMLPVQTLVLSGH